MSTSNKMKQLIGSLSNVAVMQANLLFLQCNPDFVRFI